MRNLKKILALALVFAMAFTFTASAADFTDAAEIGAKYVDDVNMLVELGVIAGYPDGSFGPQKNITRAEFAKMAYTIKYGSDTDGNLFAAQKSNFWDVEGNASVAWAKGYINYCANQNIVSGVGGGKFNPSGNITVAEATKMLLVILGCDPAKEGFTGANWVANVTSKAIDLGIYNGWTGDPSQLATRELVAKLMRNTIFSSVYTYSAITGVGSQMDALGQKDNKTLGEITMGLQTVTGIVVANERYAISTNEKGNPLGDINNDGSIGTGESDVTAAATGLDSGKSLVYYEYYDEENKETAATTMEIDRALDDDMLGAKVNVFFKADKIENNGRINYKNIEVLGNVLVHSDTVAYTVPAIATDVYPDGDSSSTSEVRPYISFKVDGVEKQIKASSKLPKVQKKVDAQTSEIEVTYNDDEMTIAEAVVAEFTPYAYELSSADLDEDGELQAASAGFITEMGLPTLSQYRFVSVDGGNTYSYMFKMVDVTNSGYGSVTSYSEASGTIRLAGDINGTYDLEDVEVYEGIATDDVVVAYRANGKVVIEKVESFTGAVESFTDDNGVVLNGNTYYAWVDAGIVDSAEDLIFTYYNEEDRGAMSANTRYYVYNNIIMELEADDEVSAVENYAVVLRSYYDADMDTAYVKLGFGDNTEGTYKVGKMYTAKASDLSDPANNRAQDFADNSMFGLVLSYKMRDDGSVDLSGQDIKKIDGEDNSKLYRYYEDDGEPVVVDGKFASKYSFNDATVIFALYGNPSYNSNFEVEANAATPYCATHHTTDDTNCDDNCDIVAYAGVKARAYKLAELEGLTGRAIPDLAVQNDAWSLDETEGTIGSYILSTNKSANSYIVAAAVTVGGKLAEANAKYDTDDKFGYIVAARQLYNNATDLYYANITMINETGVVSATTTENDDIQSFLDIEGIDGVGKIDDLVGDIVRFDVDAEGKIIMLDKNLDDGGNTNVNTTVDATTEGFYLVNITGIRGDVVSFYDTDADVVVKGAGAVQADSLELSEDGYDIIAIDEDDYAGNSLAQKVASRTEVLLAAEGGNAIIQIDDEGKIVRIFSFTANYIA